MLQRAPQRKHTPSERASGGKNDERRRIKGTNKMKIFCRHPNVVVSRAKQSGEFVWTRPVLKRTIHTLWPNGLLMLLLLRLLLGANNSSNILFIQYSLPSHRIFDGSFFPFGFWAKRTQKNRKIYDSPESRMLRKRFFVVDFFNLLSSMRMLVCAWHLALHFKFISSSHRTLWMK